MLTWKKPIAIAFATAGIFAGSAFPHLTFAQTNDFPLDRQTTNSFVPDVQPFATPYRAETKTVQSLVESTEQLDSASKNQIVGLPKSNLPDSTETKSNDNDFVPVQHGFPSTLAPAPLPTVIPNANHSSPTVIVRPPANASGGMNDLTVNIEKVAGTNGTEFAVKLTVPDSVSVIEVTPVQNSNSVRNFKIKLEQPSLKQPEPKHNDPVASIYSMPIAAPVHSASSLNAVQPQIQPKLMTPVKLRTPNRKGFRKNPFFQPTEDDYQLNSQPGTKAPKTTGPPVVREIPIVASVDDPHPQLAAFHAEPAEMIASLPFEHIEPRTVIESDISGPDKIGLGDFAEFTIKVINPSTDPVQDVSVCLDVPLGLDIVDLDREAEIDNSTGMLTWQIPEMPPRKGLLIRYRARALSKGNQHQRIWIGSENISRLASHFETDVQVDAETSEAPLLPFDSN